MIPFSLLDVVPIAEGQSVAQALANATELAAHAERLGYARYWIAEHHGMAGIASAATSVILAQIGAATRSIRIGAGGIMLPNHAPLAIAEQFGTLDAYFPGRIDLGLGRASGSDQRVARAMRRASDNDPDAFPRDVLELQGLLTGDGRNDIRATPGAGADVDLWMLGSSTYGAQLAAAMGLPYAFASHFAPAALSSALEIYRRTFRPSPTLAKPHVMAAFNVFAATTDEDARLMFSSQEQAVIALGTGRPGKTQPPVPNYRESLPPQGQAILEQVLQHAAVGTPAKVQRQIIAFIDQTGVDEIIFSCVTHDHDARMRSFAIAAQAMTEIGVPA